MTAPIPDSADIDPDVLGEAYWRLRWDMQCPICARSGWDRMSDTMRALWCDEAAKHGAGLTGTRYVARVLRDRAEAEKGE